MKQMLVLFVPQPTLLKMLWIFVKPAFKVLKIGTGDVNEYEDNYDKYAIKL